MSTKPKLTKKDYMSDQDVKWCPGCGDYAILSAVQMAMAQMQLPRHQVAVVAGIGCSSRFPYYMGTYGMHTIHGRAPAFATGLKIQNPDLSVWVITGDGDGLSIGGNHLAHIIRRNVDVNIILFNNEIYGLTKGQYSPTSAPGLKTKSTPYGSLDRAFNPASFALGAGSTFYARTIDTDPKHMIEVFKQAQAHKGCSVIEVYQNCVIFNDKVHDQYTNRATRDDYSVRLQEGAPMIFGKDQDQALVLNGLSLTVKNKDEASQAELVSYDPTNRVMADLLAQSKAPVALGVLYKEEECSTYETDLHSQINDVIEKQGKSSVYDLLHSGDTWKV